MSLLNFAGHQLQMQNSSGQNASQQVITNSVNSHRPKYEQESIEREIRINSKVGGGPVLSPRGMKFENPLGGMHGIQLPLQGRPNLQKVFLLTDIIQSPMAMSMQPPVIKDEKVADKKTRSPDEEKALKTSKDTLPTAANTSQT